MPDGQVLEFTELTKHFGGVTAVDGFTARVEPGQVTGFLGPNGAGKTTTLRMLLGLARPTSGTATIGGRAYSDLQRPLQTVGAALEASSFHPGRSAANHLKVYAQASGIALSRIDETLALVGLADAAGRKVGGFSLGMRQRLGLAYTLLGDPGVLVLDEPSNGLDPEGIKWMRGLLRHLAAEGRTVLVSSHILAEIQQTVDALLIIAHGRLVFQGPLHELTDADEYVTVVDAPERGALERVLDDAGLTYDRMRSGLSVALADTSAVGALAASSGIALSTLQRKGPALEEVFLDLVNGVRVHASVAAAGEPEATPGPETPAEAPAETPTEPPAAPDAADATADGIEPDVAPEIAPSDVPLVEDGPDALAGADADEAPVEQAPDIEIPQPPAVTESVYTVSPDDDDDTPGEGGRA